MDDLKKHIKVTKQLTEELEEQNEKLASVKEDNFNLKIDILGSAFGMLMEKIFKTVDDWVTVNSEKVDESKGLAAQIKESVGKALEAIAEQKPPTIQFSPQVKVDLKELQPITTEISRQNDTVIKLLNKLTSGDGGKSEELQKLIIAMIGKQNNFLDKVFTQNDYTKQLETISEGVNKKNDRIEKLVAKRGDYNLLTEVIPIYKTL